MVRRNLLPFLKSLARYRAILLQIELLEQSAEGLRGDLRAEMRTYVQRLYLIKRWLRREIISLGRTLRVRQMNLLL